MLFIVQIMSVLYVRKWSHWGLCCSFCSDYVSFVCKGKGSLWGLCCSLVQIMSVLDVRKWSHWGLCCSFCSDYVSFVCEEMVTFTVMFFCSQIMSVLCVKGKGHFEGYVVLLFRLCPLSKWWNGHIDHYVVLLGLLLLLSCLQID
jgi:hypothetical protein